MNALDQPSLLDEHLKDLRLFTVRKQYRDMAQLAQQDALDYESYLLSVMTLEAEERQHQRLARRIKESRLPLEKTFDTFITKRLPLPVMRKVNALKQGHFMAYHENILAFGNPGSGKTHLLCALAYHLIHQGFRVYFQPTSLFVQDLLRAKQSLLLEKYLRKLAKFDLVFIDDIGYVKHSRKEMEVLFTFLADRYESGSVMITSNLNFSQWQDIFRDPIVTAAAIDRLVHHSSIIELNLPSFRIENAKLNIHQGGDSDS